MQERRRGETLGWCEMRRKGEEGDDERRAATNLCQDGEFLPAARRKPQENLSLVFWQAHDTTHTHTHKHTFVHCCVINIPTLSSIRSDIYSQVALQQSNKWLNG